jgi:YVTN family beta-propeller protein
MTRDRVAVLALLAFALGSAPAPAEDASLLILHKGAESLGFYDAATGARRALVPVGTVPHEMVLSADGRLAYVTNYGVRSYTDTAPGGNTVSIVDLARREKMGEIDLGECRRPHGIELGPSGRLYVTIDRPGSLLVIDPASRTIVARHDVGQALPHMLALRPDEQKAWTANAGSGTVTALRLGASPALAQIPVGGVPMGLALSSDGRRLYAATRSGNEVVVIDTARDVVTDRIRIEGQPARVRFTKGDTRLLVSLIESGEVAVVDPRAGREVHRFKAGAAAEGLGLDEAGRFGYVSAQGDDTVVQFSLADWRRTLDIKTAARPDPIILWKER